MIHFIYLAWSLLSSWMCVGWCIPSGLKNSWRYLFTYYFYSIASDASFVNRLFVSHVLFIFFHILTPTSESSVDLILLPNSFISWLSHFFFTSHISFFLFVGFVTFLCRTVYKRNEGLKLVWFFPPREHLSYFLLGIIGIDHLSPWSWTWVATLVRLSPHISKIFRVRCGLCDRHTFSTARWQEISFSLSSPASQQAGYIM